MAKQHNYLTAALALALGVFATLALTPHKASGYPGGAVISLGPNPVIAATGQKTAGTSGSDVLFTAPAGQDIIVSDVVLTGSGWGPTTANYKSCYFRARLTSSVAGLIGSFRFDSNHNNRNQPGYAAGTIQHAFSSGLVVPAGETLTLNWDTRYAICDMDWTITGYYAQP